MQKFRCLECKHEFDAEIVNGAPFPVFIAQFKALYCPRCGARWKKIGLVIDKKGEETDL
jgi:rubredoxin